MRLAFPKVPPMQAPKHGIITIIERHFIGIHFRMFHKSIEFSISTF